MSEFNESVDEVKKIIGNLGEKEGNEELSKSLLSFVELAINEKSKVNKEAGDSRIALKEKEKSIAEMEEKLKESNTVIESIQPLLEKLGVSQGQPDQGIQGGQGDSTQSNLTVKKLEDSINTLTDEMKVLREEKEKAILEGRDKELKSQIISKAADFTTDSNQIDDIYVLVKGRYKQDDQGDFVTDDGKRLKDDLASYIEDRPYLSSSTVRKGSGSERGSQQGSGIKKHSEYTYAELNQLFKDDPALYKEVIKQRNNELKTNSGVKFTN